MIASLLAMLSFANAHAADLPPCPQTRVQMEIWNEEGVRFLGIARCIGAWDQRHLSSYNEGIIDSGGFPLPNFFERMMLQTDVGYAEITTRSNSFLCGANQENVGLVGTLATRFEFDPAPGSPPQTPRRADLAGSLLHGAGAQGSTAGSSPALFTVGTGPEIVPPVDAALPTRRLPGVTDDRSAGLTDVRPASASDVVPSDDPPNDDPPDDEPDDQIQPGAPSESRPTPANLPAGTIFSNRANETGTASVLVLPNVELKWNAEGVLVQDTLVEFVNAAPAPVRLRWFFINGASDRCDHFAREIELEQNATALWSAYSDRPRSVETFRRLFYREADDDPRNVGGQTIRGAIVIYAVNERTEPIKWNHLRATVTMLNFAQRTTWSYNALGIRAVADTLGEGDVVRSGAEDTTLGELNFDGIEYETVPRVLVFRFYTVGNTLEFGYEGPDENLLDIRGLLPEGTPLLGPPLYPTDGELTLFALRRNFTLRGP